MTLTMNFKLYKIKLPFDITESVMPLMDKIESYNVTVVDFDREAYVTLVTVAGSKNSLENLMKDYKFNKPIEYYML